MNYTIELLKKLRERFEAVVSREALTTTTAVRYRSWIRRFIKFCLHLGIDINTEATTSILQTYEEYRTRRQGYYALKFLFVNVMRKGTFPTWSECNPQKTKRRHVWKKFSRWFAK